MTGTVIVVEQVKDAQAVLAYLKQSPCPVSEYQIVGLEPAARAFLRRQRIGSGDTLPFFTNESHARLVHESDKIWQLVEQDLEVDAGDGLDKIYTHAFSLYARGRWALMLRTIEILDGIRCAFPHSNWLVCSGGPVPSESSSWYLRSDEGYLSSLAAKFCRRFDLPLEVLPVHPEREAPPTAKARRRFLPGWMLDWLIVRCYLTALALQGRSTTVLSTMPGLGMDGVLLSIQARFPHVNLLALGEGRDSRRQALGDALGWLAGLVLGRKSRKRIRTLPLEMLEGLTGKREEARIRRLFQAALTRFLDQDGHCFEYRGVSFLDEIRAEVENGLLPRLVTLYKVAQAQNQTLRRLCPSLVLSLLSAERHRALAQLCRRYNIPTMVIPLKGLVRPKNNLEEMGEVQIGRGQLSSDYRYAAIQTPLARDYARHVGYAGEIVPTGPLIRVRVDDDERRRQRDRFFQEMGAPGKIVVYAPSMKRLHSFHVVQTLDEVLSSMEDLVETVSGMKGVYLVLRLHPDEMLTRSDVETLVALPPGVTISGSDRRSFSGVLALADVLVSNASTAAEEALLHGVPVILYDKWARYNHLDAPEVHAGLPDSLSPAYYVPCREGLSPTLDWVLRNQPLGTPLPPASLERYVFPTDLSQTFYDFVGRMVGQDHRATHAHTPAIRS